MYSCRSSRLEGEPAGLVARDPTRLWSSSISCSPLPNQHPPFSSISSRRAIARDSCIILTSLFGGIGAYTPRSPNVPLPMSCSPISKPLFKVIRTPVAAWVAPYTLPDPSQLPGLEQRLDGLLSRGTTEVCDHQQHVQAHGRGLGGGAASRMASRASDSATAALSPRAL